MLADWRKVHHMLYEGQISSQRQQSTRDTIVRVMHRVQDAWAEGKLAGMLLMDVKSTFDHVSRNGLLQKMETVGANGDLVRWTESFLLERNVSLVVDGH